MRVKVPVQVSLTECAMGMVLEDTEMQNMLERAIKKHCAEAVYTEGALEDIAMVLLMQYSRKEASMQEIAAKLYEEASGYMPEGVDALSITVGTESEQSTEIDIRIEKGMHEEEIHRRVEQCIQEAAEKKTKEHYTVSGIWSIGKSAVLGSNGEIVQKAVCMMVQKEYESALGVLTVLSYTEKTAIMSEMCIACKRETGRRVEDEYKIKECKKLTDGLRYALMMYMCMDSAEAHEEARMKYVVASTMGQIECRKEQGVRVVLNILSSSVLESMGAERSRQMHLLMESASIMEASRAYSTESTRWALELYAQALEACSKSAVRVEIMAKMIQIGNTIKEAQRVQYEIVKHKGWTAHIQIVKEHARMKQEQGHAVEEIVCNIDGTSVVCKKVVRKKRNIQKNKETKYIHAETEYIEAEIHSGECVQSGQYIEVVVHIPEHIQKEADTVGIDTQNRVYRMQIKKKEARRQIRIEHREAQKSRKDTDSISITGIRIECGALCIYTPVQYTVRIAEEKYIAPRVKYKKEIGRYGLTRIAYKG